ncbi:MAG: SpaH/EbpB family LPXTG-anchored major pilin [Clostridia bacterium]|nr:SpaH/EbpB family LPXTG-anchored major pilin [Clostridia bacterium]
MKTINRIAAVLFAVILVAISASPAFATEHKGAIKVTDVTPEKTYNIYRIFDMSADVDETDPNNPVINGVYYEVNSDWTDFFTTGEGAAYLVDNDTAAGLPVTVFNNANKYINITDANVAEFSQKAQAYVISKPVAATDSKNAPAANSSGPMEVNFTDLDLGYYLVYPYGATQLKGTNASICALTSTNFTQEIVAKSEFPTIEKTVGAGENNGSYDIGDTLDFTIKGYVPDTTGYTKYIYKISDEMSEGLEFDQDSLVIKVGSTTLTDTDLEEKTVTTTGFSFKIKNIGSYNVGDEITVTYSAVITSNALRTRPAGEAAEESNNAQLTYSNDPTITDGTVTDDSTPVEVEIYTGTIQINKVDSESANANKLQGAEFILKKNDGTVVKYFKQDASTKEVTWIENKADATVATSGVDGKAFFEGIADGEYIIEEINPPTGYNKLNEDVTVTVDSKSAGHNVTVEQPIVNKKGVELPGTGGIGTTIFYTLGVILVLGAGILLIAKRKMKSKANG